MINELYGYYLQHKEPQKSCLLALRDIILKEDADISETVKYGMPCFCYKKKMFCYLWTDKKMDDQPYILFVEGKHLDIPELEAGSRSRMKILRINPGENLPLTLIKYCLHKALELYKNGTIEINI